MKKIKKTGIYLSCCMSILAGYSMNTSSATQTPEDKKIKQVETACTEGSDAASQYVCGPFGIAVGFYNSSNPSPPGPQFPLAYASSSNGTTWTPTITSANPPPQLLGGSAYGGSGTFLTAACNPSSPRMCIAGGSYIDFGGTYYPMLAVSTNQGVTWVYQVESASQLPPATDLAVPSAFQSSYCNDSLCLAGGYYTTEHNGEQYMMLAANTNGLDWNYIIDFSTISIGGPYNFGGNGVFSGTSCDSGGNVCIAVGEYKDLSIGYVPVLAISTSPSTTNWNYPISAATLLPSDFTPQLATSLGFNAASCSVNNVSDSVCMAAGTYYGSTPSGPPYTQYPLLAVNSTAASNQASWSYIVQSLSNLPYSFNPAGALPNGVFNGTSCNGTECIAAGSYIAMDNNTYPMVALSAGPLYTSVTYPIDGLNGPLPCNMTNYGQFNATSCTDSVCVAAGSYNTTLPSINNGTPYPMLAVSLNAGVTWTYQIDSSFTAAYPNDFVTGAFDSVTCNDTLCYAAGYYASSTATNIPLLVISSYSGVSWSAWSPQVSSSNLPSDAVTTGNIGQFNATATVPSFTKKLTPSEQVKKMADKTSNTLTFSLSTL